MSIARTLEGRLSATLALIAIIGWIVVAIVEAYPVARPDNATVIMVVSLAVVAFKFYQLDRASGKDPVTQKAQLDASVELYLDKLAKHSADSGITIQDNLFSVILDSLLRLAEMNKSESPEGEHKVGDLPKIVTDDREGAEAKDW